MNEKFELVHFDGDEDIAPKLYWHRYVTTVGRDSVTMQFSQIIKQATEVCGRKELEGGNQKLYEIDKKNDNEVDFDEQKQKRAAKGMTFAKFVEQCSESLKSKSKWHLKHLEKPLGSKPSLKYVTTILRPTARSAARKRSLGMARPQPRSFLKRRSTKKSEHCGNFFGLLKRRGIPTGHQIRDGRGGNPKPGPYQLRVFRAGKIPGLAQAQSSWHGKRRCLIPIYFI